MQASCNAVFGFRFSVFGRNISNYQEDIYLFVYFLVYQIVLVFWTLRDGFDAYRRNLQTGNCRASCKNGFPVNLNEVKDLKLLEIWDTSLRSA
jgi:hypothetical protein